MKVSNLPMNERKGTKKYEWHHRLNWQEWRGSNSQPPVLETGALPIELHSYGTIASPPTRAVSSIGTRPMARAKRLTPVQAKSSRPNLSSRPRLAWPERAPRAKKSKGRENDRTH